MQPKKLAAAVLLACTSMTVAVPAVHAQAVMAERAEFNVAEGDLVAAIREFSRQSRIEVIFSVSELQGLQTLGIQGTMTPQEALRRIVQDSGAELVSDPSGAFLVRMPGRTGEKTRPASAPKASPVSKVDDKGEPVTELQKLTVTGTRVRGAELTSPLVMITQEDMRLAGHPSLGEVLRVLPQNFSGGQNPGVLERSISNRNDSGGSSFNLRGLGADATLTLLNGSRLVYDGWIQAVDIDAIPVAAVDRVEVLLDGASAIYGSDAVAGVVNVILKRDYTGAEVSARLGTSTSGGYTQSQYTGVAGTTWNSGGLIVTGSISRNTTLNSGQRDYLADVGPGSGIYPGIHQKNVVLSGHQKLGESAELAVDSFYSDRDSYSSWIDIDGWNGTGRNGAASWGMYPSVTFSMSNDMSLKLHAAFGRSKGRSLYDDFSPDGEEHYPNYQYYENKATVVGLEFSGSLVQLPAGSVGYSIGGGYRKNSYTAWNANNPEGLPQISVGPASNPSRYAYGEIDVPLVTESQSIPLVRRISINGAVRYEDYDSFGESTTPKIGLFWSVNPSLDIKASWGRSFKAPTLMQQYQDSFINYDSSERYPGAPEGRTVMVPYGGNPDLKPEEATIVTAGLVFKPEFLEGMSVEMNWFDIDYVNRVGQPHRTRTSALSDPASEDYRIINPTLDEINYEFEKIGVAPGTFRVRNASQPWDPADVYAIVQYRYMNAASNRIRGVDLSARYAMDLSGGVLTLFGNGNWITDSTRKINSRLPALPYSGLIYTPAKFKGRIAAAWSRDAFTISTAVNHIGGVLNDLIESRYKGKPMTTVDLVLDYWMDSEQFGEWGINFGILNALNHRPPYMEVDWPQYNLNYDSTNYSVLGRLVNLTLTKRF